MRTVALFCLYVGLFYITSLFPVIAKAKKKKISVASVSDRNVKNLYFMGFFPISSKRWKFGKSLLRAVRVGIEQVNNQSVIPGYRLKIIPHDTKCDTGIGIKGLCEQLTSPPTKILIIGGGCSAVTEAIAHASHHWNLVQVSYSDMSPALSNKKAFPLFARLAVPDIKINPARVRFLQYFGWTHIAIIHQAHKLFTKTMEDLRRRLNDANIDVFYSVSFTDDPAMQVRDLKKNDCRIIVGLFYANIAPRVFCEAYKIGLYGWRIVWILNDWYEGEWWKKRYIMNVTNCTLEQLGMAVEGYFNIGSINHKPEAKRGISGWLPADFQKKYNESRILRSLLAAHVAMQGYDTVWAVALALNKTRQRLQDMGSNRSLENFSYSDWEMARMLYSSLLNVSFIGLRGHIAFDSNGDSIGILEINRVEGGVKRSLGHYDPFGGSKLIWYENSTIVWEGGMIPGDSTGKRTEFQTISVPLYVSMCVVASLGIMVACFFLIFNILLREVRLVKMSSPRFNNVILVGCILAYSSIFIPDAGAKATSLGCEIHTALLAIGSTLSFGALTAKTWRVHVIFTNTTKVQKKIPNDTRLFCMLGVLMLIILILLVAWRIADPRYVQDTTLTTKVESDITGEVEVNYVARSCNSKYQQYFLGTFYAIHVVILVVSSYLAFETRNVHYPELNDSKSIAMCIYNVALLTIPAFILAVTLNPGLNLRFIIMGTLVLLGTTVTQCLIFVPKVMTYRYNQIHGISSNILHSQREKAKHGVVSPYGPPYFEPPTEPINTFQLSKQNLS